MLNKAFIVFLATTELLLDTAFDAARNDFFLGRKCLVEDIAPLNHRHIFVVRNVLTINCIIRRLGET